jgi:hypothetical protein
MNFSEWGGYKLGKTLSLLEGICEETREGAMPLGKYTLLHSNASLSSEDIQMLCEWSQAEAGRLGGGD